MADLATFVKVRQQPAGPVETFSTERATETIARQMTTDDAATILLRFEGGARGALAVSQVSAGRKNSLQWEIDGAAAAAAWDSERPDELWIGRRERPNEVLLRNPALMNAAGTPRRASQAATSRASPTRSRLSTGPSTPTSRRRPRRAPDLRHLRRRPRRDAGRRRDRDERPRGALGRGRRDA